jgi:hypothetical protein
MREKFEKIKEEYFIKLQELKEEYIVLYNKVEDFKRLIEGVNEEYFEYLKSTIDLKLMFDEVDHRKIRIFKNDEVVPIIYDKYLTQYEFKIHETYQDVVVGKYNYCSNSLSHKFLPRGLNGKSFDWNISDGLKELFEGNKNDFDY